MTKFFAMFCLLVTLVLAATAFGGYSSSSSSSSRSSYSSGVRSYSPPARPYSAPITRVSVVSTPSAKAQPVRIVPVAKPQTVINKTVVNKTVYHSAPAAPAQDHFWSNWMMFSLLSDRHPQTVVVQGGQPIAGATMAPVPVAPAHEGIFPAMTLAILIVGGGLAFWAWRKDKRGA